MRRIASGIVVIALVIGLGANLAQARSEGEPGDRGRAHVEATCLGCHPGPQLGIAVRRRLDPGNREALDVFLVTHHVADALLRADVIAYLEARHANAPTGGR